MTKAANNKYPIHDLIRRRWSPRAFSDRPVEAAKLRQVLEAARWAASSFNEQPWCFVLATKDNPEEYQRLFNCLTDGNKRWAGNAPVLLLPVAKRHHDRNGRENRHAFHDVGLAVGNLIFQATALGLFAHQMAGFHIDIAREEFNIPDGYEPVTAIALGYLGQPNTLPEELRERESAPRTRKPLETFVFSGQWGQPSALVND